MKHNFKRTHHGKLFGIPVYLDMTDPECPNVKPKYKLGFVLDIADLFFSIYCMIRTKRDPYFEPMFPILVGDEIKDS